MKVEGEYIMVEELQNLEIKLSKELPTKRFIHTQGVRYIAASLAMRYDVDIVKAQMAALLHDCAKCFSDTELLNMCRERKISISEIEEKAPHLLHAKLGSILACEKYHVCGQDVLDAIQYHTTGRPDMTDLEKIIFIADYIEPNRKMIRGIEQCRKNAFVDLDKTMYFILENTLEYLDKEISENKIDEMTTKAYAFYKQKVKK